MNIDELCYRIIGAAMAVYRHFGPGSKSCLKMKKRMNYAMIAKILPDAAKRELLYEAKRRGYDTDKLIWIRQK